ncbi:O-antigen ligase family protein [Aquabacterium sp. A7-Y]|uniref:O-antigen ligase family protein n=1 Tax=Aquabacterium sp. A7-Y TaxID=1349605 RepID=UPI00223DEAB8|nr:O-antigen ligase family protein [Aquabacterium sp. A7-Y]MCW7537516.1 O-antigen ligase family protein [Aquabacterium sp. A7-Y]
MSFAIFLLYVVLVFLRPIELLAPELTDYRPMLWLWLLAFGSALVRSVMKRQFSAHPVFLWLLGGFTLALAVSMVANGWAGGAIDAVSQFSASALLFVLVCMNVTTVRRLQATCGAVVVVLVLAAGTTIWSYHTGERAEDLVLRQNSYIDDRGDRMPPGDTVVPAEDTSGFYIWRVRWLGFLNDPNDFAQAMVMALPLLWALYRPRRLLRNAVLIGLPSATMLYSMMLTQSRGAIMGVGGVFAVLLHKRFGSLKSGIALGLMGAAAIAASMGSERALSTKESSAGDRIEAWSTGLMMLKSWPLFGVGYGNFQEHHHLTAHNSFVLCFSELGLFGYFMWMGLLVVAYKGMALATRHAPPGSAEYRMSELLRMSFVGFLTCAWFLSRTYQPTLYFLLALCASAWYCATRLAPEHAAPGSLQGEHWVRATFKVMVLSVTAVLGFVRLG